MSKFQQNEPAPKFEMSDSALALQFSNYELNGYEANKVLHFFGTPNDANLQIVATLTDEANTTQQSEETHIHTLPILPPRPIDFEFDDLTEAIEIKQPETILSIKELDDLNTAAIRMLYKVAQLHKQERVHDKVPGLFENELQSPRDRKIYRMSSAVFSGWAGGSYMIGNDMVANGHEVQASIIITAFGACAIGSVKNYVKNLDSRLATKEKAKQRHKENRMEQNIDIAASRHKVLRMQRH